MGAYEEYGALMERMPASYRASVTCLRDQAMAYVWGREDAGEKACSDNASWDFCYAYGVHAARYALGEIGCRWSIRGAWEVWAAGGTIGVYPHEVMAGAPS